MKIAPFLIKAGGIACIMTASIVMGEHKARSLVRRLEQLRQFQRSLKLLSSEISYARSVLPYAFQTVARQLSPPVSDLYVTAAGMMLDKKRLSGRDAWLEAVARIFPETCLTGADRAILENLSVSLGISEREGQLKQIQLTLHHLDHALESAREARRRNERLWRYLGILGGMALVILFW